MAGWNQHSASSLIEAAHKQGKPLTGALRVLQDRFQYIDMQAIPLLAEVYNLAPAEIHGVISFYTDFRIRPPGRNTLRLCQAEGCQAVGAKDLYVHARKRLGAGMNETTLDGEITLEPVYCLGLCANGPAGQVNGEPRVELDPQKLDELIDGCRKKGAP